MERLDSLDYIRDLIGTVKKIRNPNLIYRGRTRNVRKSLKNEVDKVFSECQKKLEDLLEKEAKNLREF